MRFYCKIIKQIVVAVPNKDCGKINCYLEKEDKKEENQREDERNVIL